MESTPAPHTHNSEMNGVKELIEGIRRFQSNVFATRRSHFERLVRGQRPHTLCLSLAPIPGSTPRC